MAQRESRKVVIAALLGNAAIAVVKFIAAGITGSSAMLSEGVHSLVDTCNQLLMLYGMHRAGRPADASHPFGYGRELYFWAFIVALLVFALGAGVSIYEGITHIRAPAPMRSPVVNYVVLGASLLFEGYSWSVALRAFRKAKGSLGWFEAFRRSKDASTFTVLFEDSAALIGLLIALVGVTAAHLTGDARLDGVASIGIGLVLAVAAMLLARETKGLLLGEAADPRICQTIMEVAGADPDLRNANGVITQQVGPETIVAALSAEFEDALDTPRIEACVNRIEAAVRERHPEIVALFVKPQTPGTWRRRIQRLERTRG
ncbi:cation diffusion facilitator family transporter [Lysobacter sp. GX 14042]|uniref:cation diffusion facilitator family transporter n=1 Tax=Lysobacter sp. GX 14042 TaxID=2907155 RepID=UPI001F4508A9|nr:cation diffusion facilitator family transporter [Lysobacter sp. GX 14042]MCE7032962.1 cation diffusion facilitator family transporter [Lysobacter sp. GX 14042]